MFVVRTGTSGGSEVIESVPYIRTDFMLYLFLCKHIYISSRQWVDTGCRCLSIYKVHRATICIEVILLCR